MLRFLSICSGIEAASVAWEPLGYVAAGYAEIDPFASAVLAHRYGSNIPGEPLSRNAPPNFGDFTQIDGADLPNPLDVLVGGTPCQAFSIAGKRLSLADARGNLTLSFVVLAHGLADTHGLRNIVWENVPGVLNTPDNAFGCFLGALVGADDALHLPRGSERWPDAGMVAGPRARAAWRVLDAQYFGLAQRRKRVFVVADFGAGADPAAVLFERQGLRGHPPARGEARQGAAGDAARGAGERGRPAVGFGGGRVSGPVEAAACLTANGGGQAMDFEVETFLVEIAPTLPSRKSAGGDLGTDHDLDGGLIAHALRGEGFDASEDGTGRGTPIVPVAFTENQRNELREVPVAGALPAIRRGDAKNETLLAVAHAEPYTLMERGRDGESNLEYRQDGTANAILTPNGGRGGLGVGAIATRWAVRRLTPLECSRLQGFPDDHARIPWRGKPAEACPDGPQYKTYGNSMAVPVMRWIGARLLAAMPGRRTA